MFLYFNLKPTNIRHVHHLTLLQARGISAPQILFMRGCDATPAGNCEEAPGTQFTSLDSPSSCDEDSPHSQLLLADRSQRQR